MSAEASIFLGLSAEALLLAYLYIKYRQRARSHYRHYAAQAWTGKGIETAELKPRLEQVRRGYLSAAKAATPTRSHSRLLKQNREAVRELRFFRNLHEQQQQQPLSILP